MDLEKGSPQQTMINIIDIPYSSPVGGKSFPSTLISERHQSHQVFSSANVTREKVFDTFKEIKIRNKILKKSIYAQF